MSREVKVEFELRSMLIMKDTLEQMGINYKELNDHTLQLKRSYHNIEINSETGMISYDEMNKTEIDDITQEYMVNFYKDKAIREGNKFKEVRKTNGEVELHIIRAG